MVVECDPRPHLSVIFVGHVDSGKSTTCGHILFSLGFVEKRILENNKKVSQENHLSSWYLAFITDVLEEERKKGKTIEVGKVHFSTDLKRFTLLDAPGHDKYVVNMINGACQADVAVLIISARKGEYESGYEKGGQTREHAVLIKTLGVRYLIVAINKMDDKTVEWSKERFDEIVETLSDFLKPMNFILYFVPISGLVGQNLIKPLDEGVCDWYTGPCILQLLDSINIEYEPGNLQIPILNHWTFAGKAYISGKIESGNITVGEELVINPGDIHFVVQEIEDESIGKEGNTTKNIRSAKTGDDITIVTSKDIVSYVKKGFAICNVDHPIGTYDEFVARIMIYEMSLFSAGHVGVVHMHTAQEECIVIKLLAKIDKKGTVIEKKPDFLTNGEAGLVHIKLNNSIPIIIFKESKQFGSFSLRGSGKTQGFGVVVQVGAPTKKKKKTKN